MELQRRGYAECFSFMGYAPIIFISAQTGYNVNKLMQLIRDVDSQNCLLYTSEQPVTARFEAVPDGEEIRMTLRANALVHGECARCLDPVEREETVQAEWTVRERDLDDPDFDLPLNEKGHLDVDEWLCQEFMFQIPTVLLCSADCPGLCPRCGKKMAECTCPPAEAEAEPADARLAILKSLLN